MQKTTVSGSVLVALVHLSPSFVQAESPRPVQLDIGSAPVVRALQAWSRQTGLQVLISEGSRQREVVAPQIAGLHTPEDALRLLLEGSEYEYRFVNARTVAVTAARDVQSDVAASQSATAAAAPTSAASRAAGSDSGNIAEVVVTAQKREQRMVDVPISMAVVGADQLRGRQIARLDDLVSAVPGLAISNDGAGTRRISIRGISNATGSYSSVIGMYLDEAAVTSGLSSQLDLSTYDLERVEVLRGPQGTLYGEGSAGGTIRFITRDPDLSKLSASSDLSALLTENGASTQRLVATANAPIAENYLGVRVAGTYERGGGWIDQPVAGVSDLNDRRLADVRLKALWKPNENLAATLLVNTHRNRQSPNSGENEDGQYTQVFNLAVTPQLHDDFDIYNLTLRYAFPKMEALSTTTYVDQEQLQENFGFRFAVAPPPFPPADALFTRLELNLPAFTQELRLTSAGTGPWEWTLGAYYRRFHYQQESEVAVGLPIAPGDPLPATFPLLFDSLSKSKSIFGDVSVHLFDRLTIGVGARYFEDEQEYSSGGSAAKQQGTFHSTDPRVYLQYKLTDNANVYASAAEGFRSGGFNALDQPSYGPESVRTYELGTKLASSGGQLTVDAAVFYSDYTDYQVFGILPPPSPPLSIYSNAGSAWLRGLEASISWSPSDRWNFSLSGETLKTKFYRVDLLQSPSSPSPPYLPGDRLDFFPEYSATGSIRHDLTLGGRRAFVRVDYSQRGSETQRNRTTGPFVLYESDTVRLLNLNAGLTWSDSLRFGVFAQNLLNDRGLVSAANINPTAAGQFVGVRSRPRSYGIELSMTFE